MSLKLVRISVLPSVLSLCLIGSLYANWNLLRKVEKLEDFSEQLSKWVDNLKKVDTNKIEPLHNVTEKTVSIRNDEVSKSNSVDDVLSNAPERAQNFFKVPKVVE